MKSSFIYILIAIIIIAGAVFLLQKSGQEEMSEVPKTDVLPAADDITIESNAEVDTDVQSEPNDTNAPTENTSVEEFPTVDNTPQSTSMPVPAPGNEDIEEMVVHEDSSPETHVFDLDGFNFGYSVKEIKVKEGDTVTINLTSTDGFHDWLVDEFNAKTDRVNTGQTTSVTFVANKAGSYEYYCSVGQHRANGMVGTLIVE